MNFQNQINLYLTKPPWNQINVLEWNRDSLVLGYHMSNSYYKEFTITAQQILDLFLKGIPTSQMKQWLLYSSG